MAKIKKSNKQGVGNVIGTPQSQENRKDYIPVPGMSSYELAKSTGEIPQDMTIKEFLNRPVEKALEIVEATTEV